ncbi:MAG: hypothetical protein Q9221_006818 [Calogaya cf. arnoldii]
MSAPAAEVPTFAFAYQARRFACDRCHRYKLKCERGPLIMTSGVPTPLGPCKRCEKARVDCTSSNTASASSSKHKEVRGSDTPTNPTKTTAAAAAAAAPTQASSNATDTLAANTHELAPFSPSLVDPSLFLDHFDFDLGAVSGDRSGQFDISPVFASGLASPDKSSDGTSNTPTTESRAAEQHSHFDNSEDLNGNGLAMSDLLNTSPTESPGWSGHQPLSSAAGAVDSSSHPSSLKETLQKLGELQSFIFREFGSISEVSLAATFLSQSSLPCNGTGNASSDGNLVGKVLCASEGLIAILTSCGRQYTSKPVGPLAEDPYWWRVAVTATNTTEMDPQRGTRNTNLLGLTLASEINIAGFRIQLEMLTHTLEQIDDAWAAALKRGSELSGGKHRDGVTATRVLMQSMLAHEGFDCGDDTDAIGLGSLMGQVEDVKHLLRTHGAANQR